MAFLSPKSRKCIDSIKSYKEPLRSYEEVPFVDLNPHVKNDIIF